jgi:hypothetical protein
MTRIVVQATLAFNLPNQDDPRDYADALTARINELVGRHPANVSLTIGTVFRDASTCAQMPLEITDGMRRIVQQALRGESAPREFAALCALAEQVGIDLHRERVAAL